jgi:hypothetical protein
MSGVHNLVERDLHSKDKFASETKSMNKVMMSGKPIQRQSINKIMIASEMVINMLTN